MREVGDDAIGEQRAALSRLLPEIDLTDNDAPSAAKSSCSKPSSRC